MASVIPAFMTAMQDPELRGAPREVYLWLHERLDLVEYREVKAIGIQEDLRLHKGTVSDALELLVRLEYLSRGARNGRIWTYRLVYSTPSRFPKPTYSSA